ncbi:MAG: hypothetical protein ABF991_10935 [Liquorilactobacillus hordei]|uniref:hypothetical protein n=1 Tax=Liquorilactobacillus hordei TaxID=468911 RepID=UPI0039EBD353
MSSVISAVIAAIVSFVVSGKMQLNDSLDTKSGWRKHLFEVASKEYISLSDVYTVKTTLRFYKHEYAPIFSFYWMTNLIISITDNIIESYSNNNLSRENLESREPSNSTIITNQNEREIIRICCRYLLKHHWEARSHFWKVNGFSSSTTRGVQKFAMEAVKQISEQVEKIEEMGDRHMGDKEKEGLSKIIDDSIKDSKAKENKRIDRYSNLIISVTSLICCTVITILLIQSMYKFLLKTLEKTLPAVIVAGIAVATIAAVLAILLVVVVKSIWGGKNAKKEKKQKNETK